MQNFDSFLSSLTIGSPTTANALSVYPLLRSSAEAPFYDTLSDAVRAGTLHITEVSAAGSVPELRVVNDGKRPVLIIDGEELIGAKQNRIVNLTVLVPSRRRFRCRSRASSRDAGAMSATNSRPPSAPTTRRDDGASCPRSRCRWWRGAGFQINRQCGRRSRTRASASVRGRPPRPPARCTTNGATCSTG